MFILLSYYVLFYSFNCHILELFWLIGFFVVSFYINNTMFCKTNSSGTTLDTRIKYFMQPCWWISFFSIWCTTGIEIISNIQWLFETQSWGWVMSWSRPFVSNIRCQRSLLKTDSCDWALSRSGVSNQRYLQLIFETCSSDRDAFGASVSNLRFQRCFFQRYAGGWVPSRSDVLVIETPRLKSTVSTVTFRDRYLGMSYVSISGMIETVRLKSTVSTVIFEDRQLW